jgi:hypothetical protein
VTVTAWTLRGRLDATRTVTWSGADWTADPATAAALGARRDGPYGPAPLTPVGPVYQPRGKRDAVALYLNALALMPGGAVVDGMPPDVPSAGSVPDGAVS